MPEVTMGILDVLASMPDASMATGSASRVFSRRSNRASCP
jgi:hypothetical protein